MLAQVASPVDVSALGGRGASDFLRDLVTLRPELRARAMRLTRNEAAAEDLVQDAIERAIKFREQFVPGTNLRSWAQTIVFSVFVTGWRRKRRERDAVKSLAIDPCAWTAQDSDSIDASMHDLSPRVRLALEALPSTFRDVVLIVDVGERSYKDAADTLGIPVGTVMSRLHRARKQLAAQLRELGEAGEGAEERLAA
jgi:RNA polymerase sigma-70 factor (ECF subfamily)